MKAVVLVGGEGTRLRPLTTNTPKPLLPVVCEPLVERQLRWLGSHGVDEVVLAMGYLPDAFWEHFPSGTFEGITLQYAVEREPLGTAGAIRFAVEHAGFRERVVVCNGDVLTTLDLKAFVSFHVEHRASATIHLSQVEDPSALGAVPTYPDGEVEAFVEKPPPGTAPSNWINAGTYVLETHVLDEIPSDRMVSIEHETFPHLLEDRGKVFALETEDYWLDVGTPKTYLQAHADALAGKLGLPPVPDAREVSPGIWVQGDAQAPSDADLVAPVLIGANASIGTGARVRGSTIGPGAVVASGVHLEDAVLHQGARVEADAVVRASILGADSCVDARAEVLELSIVGPGATVPTGTAVVGGRVPVMGG